MLKTWYNFLPKAKSTTLQVTLTQSILVPKQSLTLTGHANIYQKSSKLVLQL